ncbi:MAG TPA: Holliday junction resolvase Hjc [Candidatus Nanoarchaeia archaeon]|nr:Holliday junction resolvase Hjc [Candidatus Nanoarchaeia archaeon]
MSRKSKGINAEREIIHKFWGTGNWCALRVAGSGSMKYPSPDILASNKLRRLAIECKTCGDEKKYIPEEDIQQLKDFIAFFGGEPWLAIKFDRMDWYFLSLEDLEKSEKSYVISKELAKNKGLLFEELTKHP